MWVQIKSDFFEEIENGIVTYIDAWKTTRGEEQGKVIAKVYGTNICNEIKIDVEYLNEKAINDEYAQEIIKEAIKDIKQELQ